MALQGTVTVTTSGNAVLFSSGTDGFRAHSLYFYGLTTGNSFLLAMDTTSGNSTGFTVPALTMMQFTNLGGVKGFSIVASTAAGSMSISYLATR